MSARSAWVAAVVVLLAAPVAGASGKPLFAEPEDGPDPRGLTLYGSGLARVAPPSRLTEQTIARAVDAARPTAQLRALHDARRRARSLAKAAGLTLGSVRAATDRLPDLERFAGGARHCHPGRRRGAAARLRCRVPDFASASLRVTFATLETSAVVPTRRAIAASASADAPVRPRHRTSPAIRAALGRAQLVADPLALAGAARRAAGAARAAGSRLGSLFALAEEPRPPFLGDIISGSFGPGRFCGRSGAFRFRRDPVTGERRRTRGRRLRRCYIPSASSALRVTFTVAGS